MNPVSLKTKSLVFSKNVTLSLFKRLASRFSTETERRICLFATEQKRQRALVGRVEKIEINYEGPREPTCLVLNKHLSTPYDCAMHIGEIIAKRSALALINGNTLWHMHKPLRDSCNLQLLHYNLPHPAAVNKAFWRTCSFLLGAVASNAFKDNVEVHLHSFPSPNVRSGSFVYDVQVSLDDWKPSMNELKVLSIETIKFCQNNYKLECLEVSTDFALDLFKSNPHKSEQIPDIAAHNEGKITLFKAGPHIDISKGPMITNTNHVGRFTVTNVIKLNTTLTGSPLYRFQGVALPHSISLNHVGYSILEERGKKLNSAKIPFSPEASSAEELDLKQAIVV